MPKLPPVTCRICHNKFDRNTMIEVDNKKWVCQSCKDAWDKKQEEKQKEQEKKERFNAGLAEKKEKSDEMKLKDEIWEAIGKPKDYNWVRYSIWLKSALKDGCTINGLRYTLRYMQQNNIVVDNVYRIKWYYDEAKAYLMWKKKMQETVSKSKYGCGETVVVSMSDNDKEDVFV